MMGIVQIYLKRDKIIKNSDYIRKLSFELGNKEKEYTIQA